MLSAKQLQDVCLAQRGDHRQCRYLAQDELDWRKWYCHKLLPNKKAKIDSTVKKYVEDCRKSGLDPRAQAVPLGDNCSGYPLLRHVEQGYDKDP